MYTKSDICVSTFVRRIICGISDLFFLQCIFVFANLIHYAFLKISQHFPHYYTREGGRAYGGPPRGYLQEIYCLQVCRGRREGRGGHEEGMRGEVPHNILGVSPLDFGGTRRSQRIAAIVNRGKHRVSSGGPRLRYKIPPRVTRCSPPEETRGFSRPAARYSIRRARGTIARIMGSFCGGRGAWNLGGTRPKEISSLSSCAPFSEQAVCAAIQHFSY